VLGDGDRECDERADRGVGMTRADGMRIDDDRGGEVTIIERGTQKLCVSGRSIEALVQA
jgi:hypothetical protein